MKPEKCAPAALQPSVLRMGGIVLAILLVALGLIVPLTPPVNPDISWLSYVAGEFLDGAVLYVDLIEIKPPAILFFNLPAAWLADLSGVDGSTVYTAYVGALALGSVASVRRLLGALFEDDALGLDLVTLLLLLVLFTLTGRNFGQAEHVMLVLALPYLAAASLRMAGRTIPPAASVGVGLLAGVGLSLKPHFLVVWMAVEALVWARTGDRGVTLLRRENFVVAAVLALYGLTILLVTPHFFTMAEALGETYLGYLNGSVRDHLAQPAVLFVAVAVVVGRLVPLHERWRALRGILGVAAVAMLVMAAVQLKAWSYHYYPAFATAIFLLGLLVAGGRGRPALDPAGVARLAAAGTLAVGVAGGLASIPGIVDESRVRLDRLDSVTGEIEQACGSSPRLAVFSPDAESAFPLVTGADFRWGMPISSLWPMSAVYERQVREEGTVRWHDRAKVPPAERFLRDRVVAELSADPPDLILVDRVASRRAFGGRGFGYVDYFEHEPALRSLMARYRPMADWSGYDVYVDTLSRACAPLLGRAGP